MIHVFPVRDEREHDTEGTTCWCCPKVDWTGAEALCVHNSADGREVIEEAERIKAETESQLP